MPVAQQDFVSMYYWAGQGDGNCQLRQAMANDGSVQRMMRAVMKRATAARAIMIVMRMVGGKEGKGNGNKGGGQQRGRGRQGDSDGNKGGGQVTVTVRKRVMAVVMATRVAGEQWQQKQRGRWSRQQGWKATKRVMVMATVMTWAMVTATRVAGNIEGNDEG
jgi:hypothetical protein